MLLPPDLTDWVPDDHLVWSILGAVDEMDLSAFYGAYRENGQGRAAYEPSMMAHHRGLIRRSAVTITPIGPIERIKVHLLDRIDHKPRQMITRHPIPNVRRQQKPLLTTALNEVLRHAEIVLIVLC